MNKTAPPVRAARLRAALAALKPSRLELEDVSARHAGHAGVTEGETETHFRLHITAQAFSGLSAGERHRLIHRLIAGEWRAGLHALTIKAFAPEEDP